jgi:bifunctional UDP-N-acetylglucosamine pyrophosphorylase/glucosamine-1-phosphate N-acetyltransferase
VIAIVLAAGLGTRMRSRRPKVLHPICGRPMLAYSLDTARAATGGEPLVVISPEMAEVSEAFAGQARFAVQDEPLGTADALRAALTGLEDSDLELLVLGGDTPFLRPTTLEALVAARRASGAPLALLTARVADPDGYGRVIHDAEGHVSRIVEHKDASPTERAVDEVNAGVYALDAAWTRRRLPDVPRSPASGELYLTELVRLALADGAPAVSVAAAPTEVAGINDRVQLAEASAVMRRRILEDLMRGGVTVVDPATTYVDATVTIAPDVTLEPGVVLRGATSVGEGSLIGTASQVIDSAIGQRCRVWASVLEGATLEDDVQIGPFAHLRPGAVIGSRSRIGNFAEVKQSRLGAGVQQHHFSYVGDAEVGARANIGAGTVTANYDGTRKNRTIIGEGAFIGSDSMLVAPIEIGAGAMTAAGSVVTHDVPPGKLAVGVPARIREPRPKTAADEGSL